LRDANDLMDEASEEIAKLKSAKAEQDEFEKAVGLRMRPGLSRDQAIAAEKRQREYDAAKKAAAEKKAADDKAATATPKK
jgi:hypothetical protein